MTTKKVKMKSVKSSQIKSIGWVLGHILYVRFHKGGLYRYQNVPESIYNQLLAADSANKELDDKAMSIGSLFHTLIKLHPDKYPFERLEIPEGRV